MGLTKNSVGLHTVDSGLVIQKHKTSDFVVALAGNPNVGKSTVFNALTGLNQHTGNWPGKTVSNAQGYCSRGSQGYILVDIPGCYSLLAHSAEEEVARDFICFGEPDAVVVVCDATSLERNLNLVLQTTELCSKTVVCVNLLDEAKRKGLELDLTLLSRRLGVPVVGASAREGKGLEELIKVTGEVAAGKTEPSPAKVVYDGFIEDWCDALIPAIESECGNKLPAKWLALRLLDGDDAFYHELEQYLGFNVLENPALSKALDQATEQLVANGKTEQDFKDAVAHGLQRTASYLCKDIVSISAKKSARSNRNIDRILTGKWTGFPIMFVGLLLIFWLTINGANYPSKLIGSGLFWFGDRLFELLTAIHCPSIIISMLIDGVYRVLAWVVSVMLPPMAIFFPLFTLLEDLGYLPRVAFCMDKCFKKCAACGKQCLTMCMGFGCNAAGVVGCRIIDSPRERLIAIITNNFVPCNGRFPTLIAIITMFFLGAASGLFESFLSAFWLALVIVLGIVATLVISKVLSKTLLKGVPSSFTLELPPYRKPQIGKILVRSVFDRTLFVLGRAVSVAAPAGLVIWLMANITVGGATLLAHCSAFLDPFAHLMGMDGVILLAFILGFPANEIVFPIIIMAYMAKGSIMQIDNLSVLRELLMNNGWTATTAICVMLFSLMHWPCSTTMLTIKKETASVKWTAISFAIPTITGVAVCMFVHLVSQLI